MSRRRYELTDFELSIIQPLLPNKPRGVPRVDDRKVLNGILWRFRTGSPWADILERYGPHTTCYNRFVCWRKAGVWDRLLADISKRTLDRVPAMRALRWIFNLYCVPVIAVNLVPEFCPNFTSGATDG